MAISAVTAASSIPSGIGSPASSSTASVIMWWPTLRTSIRLRPWRRELAAVRGRVAPVRVEAALDRPSALLEALDEVAAQEAEPVAVDHHLVLGVDGGDRILQVHDGGDGRFEHHVGDAGRVVAADRVRAVDPDLQVEVVVAQQDGGRVRRIAGVADELLRPLELRLAAAVQHDEQRAALDAVGAGVDMQSPAPAARPRPGTPWPAPPRARRGSRCSPPPRSAPPSSGIASVP